MLTSRDHNSDSRPDFTVYYVTLPFILIFGLKYLEMCISFSRVENSLLLLFPAVGLLLTFLIFDFYQLFYQHRPY